MGVAALAVILGLRFSAPRVPGALVLVVGGLLATPLFNLDAHGVALVGDVPRGLPVSTSLSASSLNESAGARTPLASLVTGGLVLLTVRMSLARVKPAVAQVLASDGVLDRLGPDRVHGSLPLAVDPLLAADDGR